MSNAVIKRIAISLLAILILAYVIYQAFSSSAHTKIKTETAMHGTMWYSVEVDAIALRDEEIIMGNGSGKLSFSVEDGNRVSSGSVVASVFSTEKEAQAFSQLKVLKTKIDALTQLNSMKETYQLSPEYYEGKIKEQIVKIQNDLAENGLSDIEELKQELLSFMNQKDVAAGNVPNYDEEISKLNAQYDELSNTVPDSYEKIYAPHAGYFIRGTDGYEEVIDFSDVLNITTKDIDSLENKKAVQNKNAVGRVCKDHGWYVVFNVSGNNVEEFEKVYKQEETVYINFPFTSMDKVPATVAAVNINDKEAAVVLRCDYMNSQLALLRKEKIEVQIYSYEGVMVSTNSLHFANVEETVEDEDGNKSTVVHENVQGVYIVDGAQLKFVQVIPKATIKGYVVCKTKLSENDVLYTDDTISLYDEVVISGKDLYDGKYIE